MLWVEPFPLPLGLCGTIAGQAAVDKQVACLALRSVLVEVHANLRPCEGCQWPRTLRGCWVSLSVNCMSLPLGWPPRCVKLLGLQCQLGQPDLWWISLGHFIGSQTYLCSQAMARHAFLALKTTQLTRKEGRFCLHLRARSPEAAFNLTPRVRARAWQKFLFTRSL